MSPEFSSDKESSEKANKVEFLPGKLADFIKSIDLSFKEQTSPEEKRENTRGFVTTKIITMYVVCTVAIIGIGLGVVVFGEPDKIKVAIEALKTLVEFLNVLVLPIITLVLGFYFGSEKK